jgi:phenylacetate-CoA ligase
MSVEDRLYPLLSKFQALPEWMQFGIASGYRLIPRRFRLGKTYQDFENLIERSLDWSSEEIEEYQFKQLRKVLIHAGNYCTFYQRKFSRAVFRPEELRTVSDMAKCPLLDKSEIQQNLSEMTSTDLPKASRLYMTTGGSTGVPVPFYLHKGISRPKEQAFLEAMWKRAGYFNGAKVAVIRGQVTSAHSGGKIVFRDYVRNWLMLSSYHLTEERWPEYMEALESYRPDFLHAYPSAALQIAEYLEKSGQTWRIPLKALLCGSEQLTLPQKRMLERIFHCRVYRWYGHSERAALAGEGASTDYFYFWPQYGYVEFGPPDAEGLREVIATSFHNFVMPLVRYRTGDMVELTKPSDPKEFDWPAAVRVAGRGQEFLVSKLGRRISLTAINMHDDIFDYLLAVQFFQEEPGITELRYVPGPGFSSTRLGMIEERLKQKLGEDFELRFAAVHEVEKTSSGKHRWLISNLQPAVSPEAASLKS